MLNNKNITKDQYMKAVNAKLSDPATKKLLMFGALDMRYAKNPLRNEEGYISTANNILQSAENFWDNCKACDGVAERIANFTQMPGYSDISNVKTMGAIDMTIVAMANSLIPYVAVDRGMKTPIDTIYYQNIVARNTAGGVTAGDNVYGNFNPPNMDVDLGLIAAEGTVAGASADAEITIAETAIPGQIKVTITNGTNTYVGQDFEANGTVYFAGLPTAASTGVTVDYAAHKITAAALATGYTMTATWVADMTKNTEGTDTLKVSAEYVPLQLVTSAKSIILEANLLNNAWINKTHQFAGGTRDYADIAFGRMSSIYIEAMNKEILRTLTGRTPAEVAYHESNKVTTDFSTYDVDKFAATKNDIMNQFVISMSSKFLARTSVAPTVIMSGTAGVGLMSGIEGKWTANAAGLKGLNGLAGYFDGIPVIRHNYFDRIATPGQADFYMASKFADNSVGSAVFGEYLPLTNTGNVNNFNNPIQVANGFFSVVGSQIIEKSLVQKGTVRLPAVMSI